MENEADLFYRQMPKVELHAHLNGSVSFSTIEKLMARKPHLNIEHNMTAILSGQKRTLDECFQVFKVIHQLIDTEEDILMVAKDVIREFAEDGVKYLELRTTPREDKNTGMTKRSYVQTVIEAIRQCKNEGLDIEVRLLVSVDRRHGVEVAMKTVKLAEDFMRSTDGFVVGLDLSGDPTVGHGGDLLPALQKAKNCGLKLSLHLSEVPSQVDESELLLNIPPDRIGHGTFLHPEVGGAQSLVDKVMKNNTPLGKNVLKLCLTSNVKGQTVSSYSNHHLLYWYQKGHPIVILVHLCSVPSRQMTGECSAQSCPRSTSWPPLPSASVERPCGVCPRRLLTSPSPQTP
ncbi:adenosine deaminase-like protein isoform X3 [Esox lucius]|uniref:adenosine deaminase-like protein isoform X3 n=1 Tax=Esox lucius TaxID=8010 RepID=UPI001476F435|nr:adenosine deaminase-like protein isoform X3 [Esox lucius]